MISKNKKYMSFLELAKNRKTTYEFDPLRKVSDSDIKYILEAARWAPSCVNLQPWKFIVIKDKKTIDLLLGMTHRIPDKLVYSNPPLLIAFALHDDGTFTCYEWCDQHKEDLPICLGMSVLNAALAAADIGVDSCILTPRVMESSKLLKTKDYKIRLLLGLGYERKDADKIERTRKELNDITYKEFFGKKIDL